MNATEARECIDRLARDRREQNPEHTKELTAALTIIAEEIYSQDSHFVFELIQNAEDNAYPEGSEDRYVHFILDGRRICVANNEVGFSEGNVKAICSVGRSTKVDRTRGYVGEKGIGFKSVFKVTEAPEVHSGPFHFRFDAESYVVPAWCDPPGDLGIDPTATTIVLPLRPALRDGAGSSLRSDFRKLPGETLLFLKTVNRIVIEDRGSGLTRRLQRRDGSGGVVEILDGTASTGWWIHRREVAVPAWLKEKKRQGVKVREIILAFRTDPEGHCLRFNDAFVYAFLPTGLKPGLPFLVQGDFLTTAGRESIHVDSDWNKWLRNELAPTYLQAIRKGVVESEAFRLTFLQTLPLPDEVGYQFFKPVANEVLAGIAQERVFPGESGQLRPLTEVFAADETMRRLFPSESLSGLLGIDAEYLDPRFRIPEAVAGWLEIPNIQSRIETLLGNEDWLAARDYDWFIDLYGYLHEHPDLIADEDLQALPIVRLEDGRLVAIGDDLVYLPPSEERVEESYGLKQFTFLIVAHAIVRRNPSPRKDEEKLLNKRTKAARDFLVERLGVKQHRPMDIAFNLVLPYLAGRRYASVESFRADFGLVLYIKEHWSLIQSDADEAKMDLIEVFKGLPLPALGTRKKQSVRKVRESYLPAELGGDPTFARLFQGVPDVWFVDADLLAQWDGTRKKKERKLKEWQAFLTDLGAPRGMRLVRREWCRPDENYVPPEGEFAPFDRVTGITSHTEIADLPKLFAYLADKVKSTRDEKGKLLLKLLDNHWAEWKEKSTVTNLPPRSWWESIYAYRNERNPKGRDETKILPSEFVRLLREESWVPIRGDGVPLRPGDVWLRDDGLGLATGRCLAVPLENENLIDALGLRTRLTVEELLAELDAMGARREADIGAYRQLFGMLAVAWREEGYGGRLADHLKENRLIFLPGRSDFPFAAVDDVVWRQPPGRLSRGIPALESAYPSLKDFFMRLDVPLSATPTFALKTLGFVHKYYNIDKDADRMALERLRAWEAYQSLAEADFAKEGSADELKKFQSKGVLLGEDGRFYPCHKLFAPDDRALAALFRRAKGVTFLHLPEEHPDAPDVARSVADRLDLTRVSKALRSVEFVEAEADPASEDIARRFDEIRRDLLGFIRKESRASYDTLVGSGEGAALAWKPLRFADLIKVRYTLLDCSIVEPNEPALAIDQNGLILQASRSGDDVELGAALQSTLDVKGLSNAFMTLMSLDDVKRSIYVDRMDYLVPDEEWVEFDPPPDPPPPPKPPKTGETEDTVEPKPEGEPPVKDPWPRPLKDRPKRVYVPPKPGRKYEGPTKLRSPQGSNKRLRERLKGKLDKPEVEKYPEEPPEFPPPVGNPDLPTPASIRTTLFAVNLEHGFLRFAPPDFRIFGPDSPVSIDLIDDDDDRIEVDVDYKSGILHGPKLTDWLALHAEWPYGAILHLDPTISDGCYHLHAQILETAVDLVDVKFFDFDDEGVPKVLTAQAVPFTVDFDENVYRQERRWENKRAYEALIELRGDGVLTSVYDELANSTCPLSASEIHRALFRDGHPCSFFSVRAILYGYSCFTRVGDRWELAANQPRGIRPGYRILVGDRGPVPDTEDTPLSCPEASRLVAKLRALSKPDPDNWQNCLTDLLSSLAAVRSRLENTFRCHA